MNAANILTLLRLVLAPLFAWMLYTSQWVPALVTLLIAIGTDMSDGYLARRLKEETAIGKFLDPLADKLFFGMAMTVLIIKHGLPLYYFLALTRDVIIGIGTLFVIAKAEERKKVELFASGWGKATTTLQAITIVAVLFHFFAMPISLRIIDFLVLMTFILSVVSIGHYGLTAIRKGYI